MKLRITLESTYEVTNDQDLSKKELEELAWAKASSASTEGFKLVEVMFVDGKEPRSYHDCNVVEEAVALVKAMDKYGQAVWNQAINTRMEQR